MLRVFLFAGVAILFATYQLGSLYLKSDRPLPLEAGEPRNLQSEMVLISHAGAGLPIGSYSNSLESLEQAVSRDLKLIEIDFHWTKDQQLVLLHDWRRQFEIWFDISVAYRVKRKLAGRELPMTKDEFLELGMLDGLTQLSLDDLADWMIKNPDILIVTDVKADNVEGLRHIAQAYPLLINRFVPQIYSFTEFEAVRDIGFDEIVFTGYRSAASNAEIVEFANTHELMAVTVPQSRLTLDGLKEFSKLETQLWTHTVNDPIVAGWLHRAGVDGLYTDLLVPFREAEAEVASSQ